MSDELEGKPLPAPRPQRPGAAASPRQRNRRARTGAAPQAGPHLDFAAARRSDLDEEDRTAAAAAPRTTPARDPEDTGDYQLEAVELKKTFYKGSTEIPVLKGINLGARRGEFLAIAGQSGSGKSTLLHLLGTLDAPDAGEIYFNGRRIDSLPGSQRDRLRNRQFGMIFQFYHLLPELTTLENVLLPVMICRSAWQFLRHRRAYRQIAVELLEMVGLGHRLKHTPRELSGGEMQRAAIARALIPGPELLLADEPTGNLDRGTGREILELLYSLNRQHDLTIVMVTHDPAIAREAGRVVRLVDGRVEAA